MNETLSVTLTANASLYNAGFRAAEQSTRSFSQTYRNELQRAAAASRRFATETSADLQKASQASRQGMQDIGRLSLFATAVSSCQSFQPCDLSSSAMAMKPETRSDVVPPRPAVAFQRPTFHGAPRLQPHFGDPTQWHLASTRVEPFTRPQPMPLILLPCHRIRLAVEHPRSDSRPFALMRAR